MALKSKKIVFIKMYREQIRADVSSIYLAQSSVYIFVLIGEAVNDGSVLRQTMADK